MSDKDNCSSKSAEQNSHLMRKLLDGVEDLSVTDITRDQVLEIVRLARIGLSTRNAEQVDVDKMSDYERAAWACEARGCPGCSACTATTVDEPPILHRVSEFLRKNEPKSCSCNDPEDGVQCWHHEIQSAVTRVIAYGVPSVPRAATNVDILDEYRDRYPEPEYDSRYRCGRMAEELAALRARPATSEAEKCFRACLQTISEKMQFVERGTMSDGWEIAAQFARNALAAYPAQHVDAKGDKNG